MTSNIVSKSKSKYLLKTTTALYLFVNSTGMLSTISLHCTLNYVVCSNLCHHHQQGSYYINYVMTEY